MTLNHLYHAVRAWYINIPSRGRPEKVAVYLGVGVCRHVRAWAWTTWACVDMVMCVHGHGCVGRHARAWACGGNGTTERGLGEERLQLEILISSTAKPNLSLVCGRYFHSFNKCLWETCPFPGALQSSAIQQWARGTRVFPCGYQTCYQKRGGVG